MANDTLKNKIRFSSTLTPETDKRLKEFSQKTDIPISKIIHNALNEYIDNKDNHINHS